MQEILSTDIMHINFLKKERFSGSSEGMRYRMEKHSYEVPDSEGKPVTPEEGGEAVQPMKTVTELRCTVWPEPFSYERTPEKERSVKSFAFTEEGVEAGRQWLNEQKQAENWEDRRLPWQSGTGEEK